MPGRTGVPRNVILDPDEKDLRKITDTINQMAQFSYSPWRQQVVLATDENLSGTTWATISNFPTIDVVVAVPSEMIVTGIVNVEAAVLASAASTLYVRGAINGTAIADSVSLWEPRAVSHREAISFRVLHNATLFPGNTYTVSFQCKADAAGDVFRTWPTIWAEDLNNVLLVEVFPVVRA